MGEQFTGILVKRFKDARQMAVDATLLLVVGAFPRCGHAEDVPQCVYSSLTRDIERRARRFANSGAEKLNIDDI